MDGARFDSLAKLMASRSRRGMLRLLVGGALGLALGQRSRPGAASIPCFEYTTQCLDCTNDPNGGCACEHLTGPCTDSEQAGAPCLEAGGACQSGSCVHAPKPDGTPCGEAQVCAGGVCCPSGQSSCGGACKNLKTDRRNCGRCGKRCKPGQRCRGGRCR